MYLTGWLPNNLECVHMFRSTMMKLNQKQRLMKFMLMMNQQEKPVSLAVYYRCLISDISICFRNYSLGCSCLIKYPLLLYTFSIQYTPTICSTVFSCLPNTYTESEWTHTHSWGHKGKSAKGSQNVDHWYIRVGLHYELFYNDIFGKRYLSKVSLNLRLI